MKASKASIFAVLGCFLLSACTGFSIENYAVNHAEDTYQNVKGKLVKLPDTAHTLPGVQFKTVELYKNNAFGPSYSYMLLFSCDAQGNNCAEVQRTPTTTPGYVSALIAPVIQAGAIVGGAALIGEGLKHSGSTVNNSNAANTSGNTSTSTSTSTATATGNGGAGGAGGAGGSSGHNGNNGNGGNPHF